MRILLVDDDEVDRRTVMRLLATERQDIEIVVAKTAAEALDLIGHDSFDTVLLDYRLPDMDGMDVLKTIQAENARGMAIIMLTGMTDEEQERQCIEAGAQDFVPKSEVNAQRLRRAMMHSRIRLMLEQRLRDSRSQLQQMAETDTLTGLGNRYRFEQALAAETEALRKGDGAGCALFLIDIDNFKLVNDSFGHHAGDALLMETAERLADRTAPSNVVCRLGGDEFAIIVPGNFACEQLDAFAVRLQSLFEKPFSLGHNSIVIGISAGIAKLTAIAPATNDLLKAASIALRSAKKEGKNGFKHFSSDMREEAVRHAELAYDMQKPDFTSQLALHYQPLFEASSKTLCGAEALVRWQHPVHGLLAPGAFLPTAQAAGLMKKVDGWVHRAACNQVSEWHRKGQVGRTFRMSFNACAATLRQDAFADALLEDVAASGAPPTLLRLEITETDLIANFEHAACQLLRLRERGIDIAIDDFGTGYSSLSYLRRLPADTVKLDRAFVKNVPVSEEERRLLKALITLAHSLGLSVTCEGIEERDQSIFCESYGADVLQGFYYGRPLSASDFADSFLQQPG
ncbi:putative bifunctional diguanylate cyclase/phosphodiesterase [Martelella limonii]|uniref:putative bifunctional diguanylate cyclase/phosphodiesterase n=1 Tax=Martelella limonii TaxID=1647649 RepID=UPI0015805537|nr:EAL domain-containing response regulator [Martelella limonii]